MAKSRFKKKGKWRVEKHYNVDKGCCLPCALAFVIQIDKEAMKVTGASTKVVGNYDKVRLYA
jgi:hypothetical protein